MMILHPCNRALLKTHWTHIIYTILCPRKFVVQYVKRRVNLGRMTAKNRP